MTIKEYCSRRIPRSKYPYLSNRFDVIGNIAIVTIHPELEQYKHIIAEAVLSERHNITTVLNKVGMVSEEARVAPFEILEGTSTVTTHREYGYRYWMDVTEAFFNPRLASERKRVIDQVIEGEEVVIPFCGVGPFAIPLAARKCTVLALDRNGKACRWLQKNAVENKVKEYISILRADALCLPFDESLRVDRAIIPTAYGMDAALEMILLHVKSGGQVHFYTFKKFFEIKNLLTGFSHLGLLVTGYRRCGTVAPGVGRFVFDMVKSVKDPRL